MTNDQGTNNKGNPKTKVRGCRLARAGMWREAVCLADAGSGCGSMGGWKDDDFEPFFFFVNAGLILKVIEQAPAGIEVHGTAELGCPGAVPLQILTGAFVPHDETHNAHGTMRRGGVHAG